MSQGLSNRAARYLGTLERRPYVDDLALVRTAIQKANLPVTEPVLDFHRTFAGYVVNHCGSKGPLGIIHREVGPQSWFAPMSVGGYPTSDPLWLACADIHRSWEMMISLDGTFLCAEPVASSYFLKTERTAFLWEFWNTHRVRDIILADSRKQLRDVLLPRLAEHRIDALSDKYWQLYATNQFAASVDAYGIEYRLLVVDGEEPAELAGIKVRQER